MSYVRCLYRDLLFLLIVDEWREPAGRRDHSTAVVDHQLYLWGGDQQGMPEVHDSAEKRQFFSSVEVFDVNTGCWEQHTTSGTPPLGVVGFACVAVGNDLHYFGGYCGHHGCYRNSVHTLSTSYLQWRMLAPSRTKGRARPMQKDRCGMVHFTDGEEDLLYVVGGRGHAVPSSQQHGAQYYQSVFGDVLTNEQQIFSLSTSESYLLLLLTCMRELVRCWVPQFYSSPKLNQDHFESLSFWFNMSLWCIVE